jgi:protein-disulfide isomerase
VAGQVSALLAGVPQHGNVLGLQSAPVTLQYFGDLQCPVCRDFTTRALPSLISRWVRRGEVKIEYRSLQTATREPQLFVDQQVAALAAGEQSRMWNFLEIFYGEQQEEGSGYVTPRFIRAIAEQVPGLDITRWSAALSETALAGAVAADAQAATADGLNGTPAFLIARGARPARTFEPSSFTAPQPFDQAIEASLAG